MGDVHLSLHLAEQQTLSVWNTPLRVALHKNKPLLLPPPLPTLLLELRACVGFWAVEPTSSCSIQKRRAIFLPERGNSRSLTGTQVEQWAPIILCKRPKIGQSLVGGTTCLRDILKQMPDFTLALCRTYNSEPQSHPTKSVFSLVVPPQCWPALGLFNHSQHLCPSEIEGKALLLPVLPKFSQWIISICIHAHSFLDSNRGIFFPKG